MHIYACVYVWCIRGGGAYWMGVCVQAHFFFVCVPLCVCVCFHACMCVSMQSMYLLVCSVSVQKNKETVITKR